VLREVSRRGAACKGMVVSDEIKAVMFCLELEVLAHCAEEVSNMKPSGRLYARKNPQNKSPEIKNNGILYKLCIKVVL
jgi:hypothetical protein